jgi:colanic acid/amylovoran biosynthesis glycosyltransferase
VEKKGLEFGIRSVARLREKGIPLRYRIAGDGVLRGDLQRLIRDCNVEDCVELLGWCDQDEIARLYDTSHVFILPSVTARNGDREGQGLVLQEAQAMGLPVISTLHNGIPDGVLDGETGLLVPEKDADALADAIERLLDQKERWPEMGRKGRAFVEENYDQKRLAERVRAIYEDVLCSQR